MHPDPHFRWNDDAAVRRFVERRGFAVIFVAAGGSPRVVHTPVTWHGEALRFHFSNGNIARGDVDGARALTVVQGPDHYVSPDWYASPAAGGQVPTWNYVAVELEGPLRALGRDELIGQVERLAEVHEGRLAPKPAWTLDRLEEEKRDRMLQKITAYEQRVDAIRTTVKLNQNKPKAEREAAAAALAAHGQIEIADWMRAL